MVLLFLRSALRFTSDLPSVACQAMARPRNRNPHRTTSDFHLFSADTSAGWRIIQRVSYAYGESRRAHGEFRRVHDEFGRHVGYQAMEQRHDATVSSDPSRAALCVPEMKANAGLFGGSRTARLQEMDRVGRHHPQSGRLLPEEDFVERAKMKVKLWPWPANRGGDRAVRVYPKTALVEA
jgi:hypothetical protein